MSETLKIPNLRDDLQHVINCHSQKNGSNTPDFILAAYMEMCLRAFDMAVNMRENWYGRVPEFATKRPTVEELEKILASEDDTPTQILPDGSIAPMMKLKP